MNLSATLQAAVDGDRAAWDALVDRFTPLVWATVRGHRLDDADAADVVQTTWLRLIEHLGSLRDGERLGAWLVTTARRESLRVIAAKQRVTPTDRIDDAPDESAVPDRRLLSGERDAALHRALAALGERCAVLLRLLAADPPPAYEQISEALDMPIGSIGPTRGRCLNRLREELAVRGITGAA